MINRQNCFEALNKLVNLNADEKQGFVKMCSEGVSIAQLFREEIPTYKTCTLNEANNYIKEEEEQMSIHLNRPYNMDNTSVPEHVYNEQNMEPEHAHALYSPVPGAVKLFEEWLEGHHPSLGCMFGFPNQNPPESYYDMLEEARNEAYGSRNTSLAFMPIYRR